MRISVHNVNFTFVYVSKTITFSESSLPHCLRRLVASPFVFVDQRPILLGFLFCFKIHLNPLKFLSRFYQFLTSFNVNPVFYCKLIKMDDDFSDDGSIDESPPDKSLKTARESQKDVCKSFIDDIV